MSEEICKNCKYHYKEEISFDYPQSCCNKTNPNHTTEEWLHCDCFEYSKNYITNLQQKVEQQENEIDRLNNIINELEKYIVEEIDDAQEELNNILQGNDLDYKNECTKEFNCIKNALDMLLDKLKELKENNN